MGIRRPAKLKIKTILSYSSRSERVKIVLNKYKTNIINKTKNVFESVGELLSSAEICTGLLLKKGKSVKDKFFRFQNFTQSIKVM